MRGLFFLMVLMTNTSFAINFVIPEINTKFDLIDSSIGSLQTSVSGVTTLADGKFYLGNASNVATEVTLSGDATVTNAGVVAIASDVIVNADIKSNAAIVYSKLALGGSVKTSDLEVDSAEDGVFVERMVKVTYDIATAAQGTVGSYDLGQDLPAKAVMTNSFCYTDVQFVDAGSGTVALSCEDANNILTAGDITGNAIGTIVVGGPKYSAPIAAITNACNITATVAGADQTAGKLTCWIKYVIHD